jgi:hypothetical protein
MAKAFASQGDMTEKKITFDEVGRDVWAFTAEGDPNSGVIIGDDSPMIVEAQATPRLANKVISHVVLTLTNHIGDRNVLRQAFEVAA